MNWQIYVQTYFSEVFFRFCALEMHTVNTLVLSIWNMIFAISHAFDYWECRHERVCILFFNYSIRSTQNETASTIVRDREAEEEHAIYLIVDFTCIEKDLEKLSPNLIDNGCSFENQKVTLGVVAHVCEHPIRLLYLYLNDKL